MPTNSSEGHPDGDAGCGIQNVEEDSNIVRSPLADLAKKFTTPEVPVTTFVFESLRKNYDVIKDKQAVINVLRGTSITFGEIEKLSKHFASALTRKGFKKGDILYFVTYDTAYLYVVQLGVWLCGGAVRGCFQREEIKEYERQMREISCRFILIEQETVESVKLAARSFDWNIEYFSIGGEIEGATSVEDMMFHDDGSALPQNVDINPREDILYIPTTNGSTGIPKGVIHTHYNLVSVLTASGLPVDLKRETGFSNCSVLCLANFSLLSFLNFYYSLMIGETYINIPKFDEKTFLEYMHVYKPDRLHCFPYLTNWMAYHSDIDKYDFSFLKVIVVGGSVLDVATLTLLSKKLPHVRVQQAYGMTEINFCANNGSWNCEKIEMNEDPDSIAGLKVLKIDNEFHVTCGPLVPFAEAKVVDINTGKSVGRGTKGKLLVRVPYLMKGYIRNSLTEFLSEVDADGWFDTGDVAFFDDEGLLYIVDRYKSMFKYYNHHVYPAEIEAIIKEHPAIASASVVAVPNPKSSFVARAYVVLKPGFQVSVEEIKNHVTERAIFYKHLHGGVAFLESIPETRGGKVDKTFLLQKAVKELKSEQ